jgi:hypothetical protein
LNPRPHKTQLENQNQIKAQEGHLEEGKTTKLTNGKKSGKPKEKLKLKTPLKQAPLNTLNASSPLR